MAAAAVQRGRGGVKFQCTSYVAAQLTLALLAMAMLAQGHGYGYGHGGGDWGGGGGGGGGGWGHGGGGGGGHWPSNGENYSSRVPGPCRCPVGLSGPSPSAGPPPFFAPHIPPHTTIHAHILPPSTLPHSPH